MNKTPPTTMYYYVDRWGKHYYLTTETHVRYRAKDDMRFGELFSGRTQEPQVWRLDTPGDWTKLKWEDYKP